nr:aminotransferase class V-fold PLP-dependent enzyme [Clostridiales bacterium]
MIYLDNAATTRPNEEALKKARVCLTEKWHNPSALYAGGNEAAKEIKAAREALLRCIADASVHELIFTSGGTEADNQAVFCGARRGNAVTTAGEHAAIFSGFQELKSRGIEPRYAKLNADGSVNEEDLLRLVDNNTSLVSVIHVNSETGAVNDIVSLAKKVKQKNPRTLFHSDGVQAFGKVPVRLSKEVDLYSVSAHKIGGVKGVGALY